MYKYIKSRTFFQVTPDVNKIGNKSGCGSLSSFSTPSGYLNLSIFQREQFSL